MVIISKVWIRKRGKENNLLKKESEQKVKNL